MLGEEVRKAIVLPDSVGTYDVEAGGVGVVPVVAGADRFLAGGVYGTLRS